VKPKKHKKRQKRKEKVTYGQAITLVILLYITFVICAGLLYNIYFPPHFKTNKTYFPNEVDCVNYIDGTFCCEESRVKYRNLSIPDFGWVEESECRKYKKVP
jgi:hypothetical protein